MLSVERAGPQRDHRNILALEELGMPNRYAQAIGEMMNGDNGLLILCGPTGSGKTTTIYSILKSLDAVKNNILARGNIRSAARRAVRFLPEQRCQWAESDF
jgi:ABC-type uncharacterized transport system ATPase subunit